MSHSNRQRYLAPAIFFGLALLYVAPFLLHLTNWGIRDWDRAFLVAAIPGDAFFHYGQFPFWNPYIGGGNIFFHHPEMLVFSPFLLLYLIFGPVIGLKLQLLVCYFFGFWGSYRFARQMGLFEMTSYLLPFAWFGSVYFALHFAEGHVMFGDFALLPWVLLFIVESFTRRPKLIWAALLVALMFLGNGGAVPFLFSILFSGLFFLCLTIQKKSVKPLLHTVGAFLFGMLIAAVKFLPMLIYLTTVQWGGAPKESIPFSALGDIFFGLRQTLFLKQFEGQVWAWQEYGAYISPVMVIVAFVAMVALFRKHWPWIAMLGFFLLLGLGDFGSFSLWRLLSHLPGFSYARCTGRAFQFVIFAAAMLGGFGLDWLVERVKARDKFPLARVLAILVPGVVLATNVTLTLPILSAVFRHPSEQVERSEHFRQVIDKDQHIYRSFLANEGSLVAPMVSLYKPSRALVGQRDTVFSEYFISGVARVVNREFTPNRISYELDAETAGKVAISMGYDNGWSAKDGRLLSQTRGLITFPFSPGENMVILTYRTPWFFTGLFITLVTLIFASMALRRSRA